MPGHRSLIAGFKPTLKLVAFVLLRPCGEIAGRGDVGKAGTLLDQGWELIEGHRIDGLGLERMFTACLDGECGGRPWEGKGGGILYP